MSADPVVPGRSPQLENANQRPSSQFVDTFACLCIWPSAPRILHRLFHSTAPFLWASEGDVRQFFGGWFLDSLGLNPAGVWLFRHRAERRPELPPKLPLQLQPQLHPLHGFCTVFSCFRSCLSGDVRHWRWPFFIFLVGVRRRR